MWEKKALARAFKIQKGKSGVTTHFSEIIKLQFWEKMSYIVMYFNAFWNYFCLIISEKCVVTLNYIFGFQQPLVRSAFPEQS